MAEGFDDIEMKGLGGKYPEHDDLDCDELEYNFHYLSQEGDKLLGDDGVINKEKKLNDYNKRIRHINYLIINQCIARGEIDLDTTFTDNDDGKTLTITTNEGSVTASGVDFVDNDYGDVSDEAFYLAFKEEEKIRERLKKLSDTNKEIRKEELKRIEIINKKI